MIPLHWHTEPALVGGLLLVAWAYALATGPLRGGIAPGQPWPGGRVGLFLAGLALFYLTVASPLDQIGEDFLFSVHMIQHELLIYAIPPLLYAGTPPWLFDAALRPAPARVLVRALTRPALAGTAFTACFTLWHFPALYEAALQSKPVHIFEHLTLFGTALMMWWPILGPSPRVPPPAYGVRMIYVFLLMVAQLPTFGFLTLTDEVHYPTYEFAARLEFLPLSPREDQILGGIIMKVTNMLVSLIVLGVCWHRLVTRDAGGAPGAAGAGSARP